MGGYGLLAIMAPDSAGVAQPLWVHSNHLGAPMLLVDASGIEAAPGDYAQIMFPGQMRTLADLYYNRYRDYDPTLGRYIQADPIGLAGGSNPYLYAEGNPLRYTDPSGRCPLCYLAIPLAEAAIPIIVIGGSAYIIYTMFNRDPAMPFNRHVRPPCPQDGGGEPSEAPERYSLPSGGAYGDNIPSVSFPIDIGISYRNSNDGGRYGGGIGANPPSNGTGDPCDEEWADAYRMCRAEFNNSYPNSGITGGYLDIQKCAAGLVSRQCMGNRPNYEHDPYKPKRLRPKKWKL